MSIYGVAQYDPQSEQTVAECMAFEDGQFLEFILTQCASIAIYNKMGYEPRMQHTITRIEYLIEKKQQIQGVSVEELKELVASLKRRSVIIYDEENDGNQNEAEFMKLEINEMESEQQKEERDRILWTRFIAEYRKRVNSEYRGNIAVKLDEPFDAEMVQELRALNEQRVEMMDGVNPKYVLRNYLMQQAIVLSKKEDYSMVRDLLKMVENPCSTQSECDHNDFTNPVSLEACGFCVSCAS